jgi:tetratricopeptide (TPR) repeat protein
MKAILGIALAALALLAFLARGRDPSSGPSAFAPSPTAEDSARMSARLFWKHFRTATEYRASGKLDAAAAAYLAALALDPSHEDALYYLGNVEMERGHYQEAERAWRRLVEVNPRSDRGYGRLGELHLCLSDRRWHDLAKAEDDFQRALHINREQTGPLLRLGEVALLQGDLREAAGYFDAVLGTDASSGRGHYFAGFLAWKGDDREGAARHYRQALAGPGAPAPGSNEGDTKAKSPSSPLQDPACPVFQAHFGGISDPGPVSMEENYVVLDRLVREATSR